VSGGTVKNEGGALFSDEAVNIKINVVGFSQLMVETSLRKLVVERGTESRRWIIDKNATCLWATGW